MGYSLEKANQRLVITLKKLGMFPLQEQLTPDEIGNKVPLSLDDLAVMCITAEIDFASMPPLPDVDGEVPDPIVVIHVKGDFSRSGNSHVAASHGEMSEMTDDMDFGDWVDNKYDDYMALFSENLVYVDDMDISVQALPCKKVRYFFQEIGEDSPEMYLERTRGVLAQMPVNTRVQ